MLSQTMETALNDQINAEMYSAYLYMSMATWFEDIQLAGFAHWMKLQAQEEMTHAIRFQNFVNERGGRVRLTAIDAPPTDWDTPLSCIEDVLEHEKKVTARINALMKQARQEDDYASESMLKWFIDEQVEEEASVDEVIGKLKLVKQAEGALFMLDNEMAARAFTWPADLPPL